VAYELDTKPLLHDYRQIHSRVNSTIQVIGSGRIEWSDDVGSVTVELQVVHYGRTRLLPGLRRTVDPTPVGNDMYIRRIICQRQTLPFADCDARLRECISAHLYRRRAIAATAATVTRCAAASGQ